MWVGRKTVKLHIGGEWFQNEHEKPLAKAMSRFYKISRKFSENKKKKKKKTGKNIE